MSDKNVLIQVKDLKKAFGTNQVLDGITTDICQGEVVAVIGPYFSPTQNQLNVFLIYQNIVSIIVANIIQYVFDYTIILLFFYNHILIYNIISI